MGLDLLGVVFVCLCQFSQQSDLGEICAELVVEVTGNPGPFFFEGLLLPETFQLAMQPLSRNVMNRTDDRAEQAKGHETEEPPGSPNGWEHGDGEGATDLIPNFVLVAGLDVKPVLSRREFAVEGSTNISGVGPLAVASFHSIAKSRALGRTEIDRKSVE